MIKFHLKWLLLPCLGFMAISHYGYSEGAYPMSSNQSYTDRQASNRWNQSMPSNQSYGNQTPSQWSQQNAIQSSNQWNDEKTTHVSSSLHGLQGIEQNLQNLLNEHGILLNQAILANLQNAPQEISETNKARLLENSRQLATLLTPVVGLEGAKQFESLFNQHISVGSQYINAVKMNDHNLAQQLTGQAMANARQLAQFFSQLSPSVPYQTWQNIFHHHVMIEAQQTKAYFQGEINRGNQLRDESLVQLGQMAQIIASAVQARLSHASQGAAIQDR